MPTALQVITYVVPARYFLIALRGIVLKGIVDRAPVAAARRAWRLRAGDAVARVGAAGAGAGLTCSASGSSSGRSSSSCGRNPRLFGVVIVAPILQLTMLGYAATTDVKDVPVVVADGDRSPASRELIARFEALAELHRRRYRHDGRARSSRISSAAVRGWRCRFPPGYGETLERRRSRSTLQVVADGTRFELDHRRAGLRDEPRSAATPRSSWPQRQPAVAGGRLSTPRIRVWFNPQLESRHFMIPGVLALLLLVVTTNLPRWRIVREKELGTLEQLNVTPLRRWELIVGKLLPYGVIALIDVLLVVGGRRLLVRGAAARQLRCCCSR